MKSLVIECEKVNFSIYQNYLTVYPKDKEQINAAFEITTKTSEEEEPEASCYDLLEEMDTEQITVGDDEHEQCHD